MFVRVRARVCVVVYWRACVIYVYMYKSESVRVCSV